MFLDTEEPVCCCVVSPSIRVSHLSLTRGQTDVLRFSGHHLTSAGY